MNVGTVCRKDPVTAVPSDDLVTVSQLMRDRCVGSVVVVEPPAEGGASRTVGVITDRDIVASAVAREADARFLLVSDVMARAPVVATEDESLGAALGKLRKIGARSLPVVGKQNELLGIVALDDIVDALVRELERAAGRSHATGSIG